MVSGTPEAAAAVLRAKAAKPVLAYADGLMDSAAYWIGSQADAIYATQSADVGCIGCYLAILDTSRADEMAGYKLEMFRSGRFKGMGAAGTSLSDEQRAMLQADVDRIAAEFKVAVRGTRGAISDELMQGQSYSVEAALAHGLVDAVTDMDAALRDVADLKTIRANRRGAI
jgi:protease-4